jgi:hypothetical protein
MEMPAGSQGFDGGWIRFQGDSKGECKYSLFIQSSLTNDGILTLR